MVELSNHKGTENIRDECFVKLQFVKSIKCIFDVHFQNNIFKMLNQNQNFINSSGILRRVQFVLQSTVTDPADLNVLNTMLQANKIDLFSKCSSFAKQEFSKIELHI